MPDGVVQFRRELLRAGSGNGNEHEESKCESAEAFISSRSKHVIPSSWIIARGCEKRASGHLRSLVALANSPRSQRQELGYPASLRIELLGYRESVWRHRLAAII